MAAAPFSFSGLGLHFRIVDSPAPVPECGSELSLAFSTTDKMLHYFAARRAGDWRVRPVSHDTLFLLISDLHYLASRGICLDPEPDGSGGTEISLGELMKIT